MFGIVSRIVVGLLGSVFGITRSGASTVVTPGSGGTLVVRQPGGTAGTDDLELSHNGTEGKIESKDGGITIRAANSATQIGEWRTNSTAYFGVWTTAPQIRLDNSAHALGWSDAMWFRDAANTIAQRNGTTAQVSRIYNTYTDASNYERLSIDWASTANTCIIGTEVAGTGSPRDMYVGPSGSGSYLYLRAAGVLWGGVNGSGGGMFTQAAVPFTMGGTFKGAATSSQKLVFKKTGIADNSATAVITVTVPNANHAAGLKLTFVSSNGSTDAFESTRVAEGMISIARTSGVDTVAVAATLELTAIATVSGGATHTLAYGVSAISGASSATQTFTVTVTIDDSGNLGSNQVVVVAELINAESTGVSFAAA